MILAESHVRCLRQVDDMKTARMLALVTGREVTNAMARKKKTAGGRKKSVVKSAKKKTFKK